MLSLVGPLKAVRTEHGRWRGSSPRTKSLLNSRHMPYSRPLSYGLLAGGKLLSFPSLDRCMTRACSSRGWGADTHSHTLLTVSIGPQSPENKKGEEARRKVATLAWLMSKLKTQPLSRHEPMLCYGTPSAVSCSFPVHRRVWTHRILCPGWWRRCGFAAAVERAAGSSCPAAETARFPGPPGGARRS